MTAHLTLAPTSQPALTTDVRVPSMSTSANRRARRHPLRMVLPLVVAFAAGALTVAAWPTLVVLANELCTAVDPEGTSCAVSLVRFGYP